MESMKNKKYKIIYADPAWSYNDKSKHRGGAERYYKTMSLEEIKNLDVKNLSDEDCVLFIWVTFPFLEAVFDVIKEWGFTYKTIGFNWVKTNKKTPSLFWGMGHWTRSNSELCLMAVKGKPKRISAKVHSVVMEPIDKHSKKPEIIKDKIVELIGDLPRLEMFAREKTKGWDVFGNEVEESINI